MNAAVHSFDSDKEPATRLAGELSIEHHPIARHRFPDGESLVRVATNIPPTALLHCSLHDPNAKLVEILLAASALRDNGAERVILVAPYLGYMRQDIAFHPGEAISQRVIGRLIADIFDACVTVDTHLHRIDDLGEIMPGIPAINLYGTMALSDALDTSLDPLIVGPDIESRQWVEAIAGHRGCDFLIGQKVRHGDREVEIQFDPVEKAKGRHVMLVDDMISSGTTLVVAAKLLRAAGAASIEAMATHCLSSPDDLSALREAGIARVIATDSVPGPTASISLAATLAAGISENGLLG